MAVDDLRQTACARTKKEAEKIAAFDLLRKVGFLVSLWVDALTQLSLFFSSFPLWMMTGVFPFWEVDRKSCQKQQRQPSSYFFITIYPFSFIFFPKCLHYTTSATG